MPSPKGETVPIIGRGSGSPGLSSSPWPDTRAGPHGPDLARCRWRQAGAGWRARAVPWSVVTREGARNGHRGGRRWGECESGRV